MSWLIAAVLFAVAGYLVGSIPFGYLAGRLRGIDIRQHGSRNVGATNVGRVLGKKWGLSVFALDVLKGGLPVALAGAILHHGGAAAGPTGLALWLLAAFAAIAGHIWPVWLRFRGGKGVATSLGVVLAVYPYFTWPGLIALAAWVAVTAVSRYVSLGSIVAALVLPASLTALCLCGVWSARAIWPLMIFAWAMPLLVIARHRANIGRLLAGTENKIGANGQ